MYIWSFTCWESLKVKSAVCLSSGDMSTPSRERSEGIWCMSKLRCCSRRDTGLLTTDSSISCTRPDSFSSCVKSCMSRENVRVRSSYIHVCTAQANNISYIHVCTAQPNNISYIQQVTIAACTLNVHWPGFCSFLNKVSVDCPVERNERGPSICSLQYGAP